MATEVQTSAQARIEEGSDSPSRRVEFGRKLASLAVAAIAFTWLSAPAAADNSDDQSESERTEPYLPPSAAETDEPVLTTEQALAEYLDRVEAYAAAWLSNPVNQWDLQAMAANQDGMYDVLAQCEVGGNWAMKGSKFSGNGFMNDAWLQYKEPGMPDNAGDATKSMQIVVIEKMRWTIEPIGSLRGDPPKWECAVTMGLP